MRYSVVSTSNFKKELKRLAKKYPSILNDVLMLIDTMEFEPMQGVSLGNHFYKIRLAVSSKGLGKSGGARVISYIKVVTTLQSTAMKEQKANEQIKKGLRQAIKEIKLIEEGKLKGQDAREMLLELIEKRGGARQGAGRKSSLQTKYPQEIKKRVTLRIYPTQLKEIEKKYGSLQSAVDTLEI